MKISRTTTLACSVNEAWDAVHNPDVFRAVSVPFLRFLPIRPSTFPPRWVSGESYLVQGLALGLIPLGTQEINPVTSAEGMTKTFRDRGRGTSGALGAVSSFAHTMRLEPSELGSTTLRDELDFRAGALTPFLWVGFAFFWWWRHRQMKMFAPTWRSEAAQRWDARYHSADIWSGKPNAALERIVSELPLGTALDVGAGEGADALWLSEQGWDVTGIDFSLVALARAEEARLRLITKDHLPRPVRWFALDAAVEPLPSPPHQYDLVVSFFSHAPLPERHALWKAMAERVAPGGTLAIVGHSVRDLEAGVRRPPADLMFDEDELRETLQPSFSSVVVATWPRSAVAPDGTVANVADVIAIAVR
ncbi:MAG: SAM-dependent methyltransferase [Pontimonas sp.]|jgi:SAM-dependent methyltransferase